ncbi:MAG: DUF1642 domain-containing protein [Bacillota bacterium]|nr:DUF1642 domain-containing protein [Bacillota bacterium]
MTEKIMFDEDEKFVVLFLDQCMSCSITLEGMYLLMNGLEIANTDRPGMRAAAYQVHEWARIQGNQNRLAQAFMGGADGYGLKEQLYVVPLFVYESDVRGKHEVEYLAIDNMGEINTYLDVLGESIEEIEANNEVARIKFTMDEIIAKDPRYKAFAVKVEEVDNRD